VDGSLPFKGPFVKPLDAQASGSLDGGPSFSLSNRLGRALWNVTWALLASWTPPPLNRWRCFLLRLFGAKIGKGVRFYGSARVWHPANLVLEDGVVVGPGANCYNQGHIYIGYKATVSQGAHLCASSHDVNDYHNQLTLRPIRIEGYAWIAAEGFVGPGVTVGEGAVLGARVWRCAIWCLGRSIVAIQRPKSASVLSATRPRVSRSIRARDKRGRSQPAPPIFSLEALDASKNRWLMLACRDSLALR
jgi:putative colanic acid biosynthesis acetyltransferase WcaF